MANEKWNEKIKKMNEGLDTLGKKIKDVSETAAIIGMETQDVISKKIDDAKSNAAAAQEQYRIASEKGKSKASSELLKMQMNFSVMKENAQAKKDARDKEHIEEYVDDLMEYADACEALAALLVDEAKLAVLEAGKKTAEIKEKYDK